MALDATGTPTSPDSIPKYNTAVDPPSGKGFNAAMDAIQVALTARTTALADKVDKPAGIADGEAAVWDSTTSTWKRSSVERIGVTSLGSGTASTDTFLRGDGAWARTPLGIVYKKNTTKTVVSSTAATDLLNGEITIAANALSATGILRLTAWGSYVQGSGSTQNSLRFDLLLGGSGILDTGVLAATSASNAQVLPWRATACIVAQNATNAQFAQLEVDYLAVSVAASATLYVTGSGIHRQESALGGYAFVRAQGYNTAAQDMTSSKSLILRITQPVSHASMSTTLNGALVEIL